MDNLKASDPCVTEETPAPEPEAVEDRILEYFWYGTVDGEAFDGDLDDIW